MQNLNQAGPWTTRDNQDGTMTILGLAVPWNKQITFGGVPESFARGAFDSTEAIGRPLLWSHQRDEPIGHITEAKDTPKGLEISAVIQPTARGRDAITLLNAGSISGLSVGFDPVERRQEKGAVQYTRARLHELSLTPLPAYPSATVTATRNEEEMADTTTEVREEAAPVVDLAPIQTRLDQIEARMIDRGAKPAHTLGVREAFAVQLMDAYQHGGKTRALADVLSSGNAGVLPPQWSSEVRNIFDRQRYLIPRLGSVAFPSAGYSLTIPKVLVHTLVGPRGAEKTTIPSRALTTGSDTFTATWYAGGVDIALELISQSDPSIYTIAVDDLLGQYAAVTDNAATLWLETVGTATGAVLDFTNYGTFVAAVMTQAEAIRAATGEPGDKLQLKSASWAKLIGMVDTTGRRIISSGDYSDGSANLLSSSVNVGGIDVFVNPRATNDVQFNTYAARIAEKPPLQVTSDNVNLMGRDVGILGALIPLPFVAAGIKRYSVTTQEDEGTTQSARAKK
jgi:HK97 family phage prohead protease/HK97 family phage major capsid protein